MYIENYLTDGDIQRAHDESPKPPPATLIAGSYLCLLEAVDIFTQESLNRVTSTLIALTPRETVILGLYYRTIGFCRTAIELKSVVHQQSLTSAERSVIELFVDMELIHRNVIADGVDKFITFIDWQKLRAARRIDKFFAEHPNRDTQPSRATVHREFIKTEAVLIEQRMEPLWGRTRKGDLVRPEHWSGLNLTDRAARLDESIEVLVIKDYDRRNFAVHTGLAGVVNLSKDNFEAMREVALNLIGDCILAELRIVGEELRLASAIPNCDAILDELDRVQVYAFADKILQALGEPVKYSVHAGELTPRRRRGAEPAATVGRR